MSRRLHVVALAIAAASTLAGAVVAIFPALVIGVVTLFYDSAGGVLILLGSLISLLPHPPATPQGGSALPIFQTLETGTGAVLLRSITATISCTMAFALLIASPRRADRRIWLIIGSCCVVASIAGEHAVAMTLLPAFLASISQLLLGHTNRPSNKGL
jgi:hypothetical protein